MNTLASLFRDTGTLRTYRAGSPVLFQGEVPRSVYIVLGGIGRAYTIASTDDERYMALYTKGDIFPLSFAIGDSTTALFYYEALSDLRVLEISKDDFTRTLAASPETTSRVLEHIGHEYTTLMLRIMALGQSRTIEKLAYTFYFLLFRYGLERSDGWFTIDVKLTQTMLGQMIGQTREGTARNLKDLVERGIVRYKGSSYSIHREKLIAMLGEDTFREL